MKIYLIGTGMGDGKTLTDEARAAMDAAEVFIGAARMLETVKHFGKPMISEYDAEKIKAYIAEHTEYKTAAVLLSGDISFYSGAKKLSEALSEHDIVRMPGISSYSYMCGKLGLDVSEVSYVSLHGDNSDYYNKKSLCNIVRDSKYTFVLLNGPEDINDIMTRLGSYKLEGCIIHIGARLGYADESFTDTEVSYMFDAVREEIKAPVSVIIENPSPKRLLGKHIEDDEFIRDKTPMTKSEIRALTVAKLGLDEDSVLYDVGAGTGSVSVEASLVSHRIRVFAIERKAESYAVINSNRCKFSCDNIMIINGYAPEVLEYLPAPTHVFIGGSGGRLRDIIKCVTEKNPEVKIVVNTVALNSAAEVMNAIKELDLESDIISVNIAKSKKIGEYDMMTGQNPVYIYTLKKGCEIT